MGTSLSWKLNRMLADYVFNTILRFSEKRAGLFFVLGISAVIKTMIVMSGPVINRDGVLYIATAQLFSQGHFQEALAMFSLPFYSFLIAVVHCLIPDWILAARLISMTALILTIIPLYLLTRALFNPKAAFWACLAFALAPLPNGWAADVIRGPLFVFIFAWAAYFGLRAIQTKRWRFFLYTALFSGVSILLRIEGVIIIPVYFVVIVLSMTWDGAARVDLCKGLAVWLALPLVLLVIGWIAGNGETSFYGFAKLNKSMGHLLNGGFLDNYQRVYDQLKNLEAFAAYPGGRQNLVEIARYFMPLLYLLGIMQIFIKVLFPFFVIPLVVGFKIGGGRERIFIFFLVGAYFLMLYMSLIEKDFIQSRFLFAPAFLMYPWIGSGLEAIFMCVRRSPRRLIWGSICIVLFLMAPGYKTLESFESREKEIVEVGEWMKKCPAFATATVISSDSRILLYADKVKNYQCYKEIFKQTNIEKAARWKKIDVIVIRMPLKQDKKDYGFKFYQLIKDYEGEKNRVVIYGTPEFKNQLAMVDFLK
jgi:4-amino-4-deoxy-L-arabinose transferase-like glycosyltransferase